jgi:hypothetical protein
LLIQIGEREKASGEIISVVATRWPKQWHELDFKPLAPNRRDRNQGFDRIRQPVQK